MLAWFKRARGSARALAIWSALIVILLAARLPFERWSEQCTTPPGLQGLASLCRPANAPGTLVALLVLWLLGAAIITFIRYVPLPKPKR